MIIVISPAKKLDLSSETIYSTSFSQPQLLSEAKSLVAVLAKKSEKQIGKLMDLSPKLSQLNYERYQSFSPPFSIQNAKQAIMCFKGDVYQSFELDTFSEEDFQFAQRHLRILSGLYGVLKPLYLMQAYRLEMGTKLSTRKGKTLYEFWGNKITHLIEKAMDETESNILINLASKEYFKSIQTKKLSAKIITPVFKEDRNGTLKSIFLFAKQARGHMTNFAIKHRITNPEDLKSFSGMGYAFHASLSDETNWVFTR